jgi:hypothetical protein
MSKYYRLPPVVTVAGSGSQNGRSRIGGRGGGGGGNDTNNTSPDSDGCTALP